MYLLGLSFSVAYIYNHQKWQLGIAMYCITAVKKAEFLFKAWFILVWFQMSLSHIISWQHKSHYFQWCSLTLMQLCAMQFRKKSLCYFWVIYSVIWPHGICKPHWKLNQSHTSYRVTIASHLCDSSLKGLLWIVCKCYWVMKLTISFICNQTGPW